MKKEKVKENKLKDKKLCQDVIQELGYQLYFIICMSIHITNVSKVYNHKGNPDKMWMPWIFEAKMAFDSSSL